LQGRGSAVFVSPEMEKDVKISSSDSGMIRNMKTATAAYLHFQ
jgi:hypothetical protein